MASVQNIALNSIYTPSFKSNEDASAPKKNIRLPKFTDVNLDKKVVIGLGAAALGAIAIGGLIRKGVLFEGHKINSEAKKAVASAESLRREVDKIIVDIENKYDEIIDNITQGAKNGFKAVKNDKGKLKYSFEHAKDSAENMVINEYDKNGKRVIRSCEFDSSNLNIITIKDFAALNSRKQSVYHFSVEEEGGVPQLFRIERGFKRLGDERSRSDLSVYFPYWYDKETYDIGRKFISGTNGTKISEVYKFESGHFEEFSRHAQTIDDNEFSKLTINFTDGLVQGAIINNGQRVYRTDNKGILRRMRLNG